jgi:hypothetical protein
VNQCAAAIVQLTFDSQVIEVKPADLIGDRACDGEQLGERLRAQGSEMIAPRRFDRKRKTQIGRRMRRCESRRIDARNFAWARQRRRLLVRWAYCPPDFLGFVQSAGFCILLMQF